METLLWGVLTPRFGSRTDPTYKEWKQTDEQGQYIEVMAHGSYLQGMETRRSPSCVYWFAESTDPTYKEWKHATRTLSNPQKVLCTDPTYKEWKHISMASRISSTQKHGSYLQGMETS